MLKKFNIVEDKIHFLLDFNDKEWRQQNLNKVMWKPKQKIFVCPASTHNLLRLMNEFMGERYHHKLYEPVKCESYLTVKPLPLWEHQERIKEFILSKRNCIISAEMRTGKTRATMEAIREWFNRQDHLNSPTTRVVWWVAPKSATRGLKMEIKKLYPNGAEFETIPITYEQFQKVYHKELVPPVVVFDEVHKLKTMTSNRAKTALFVWQDLEDKYGESFLLVGLSGTPAPKDPTDWLGILSVIVPAFVPYPNQRVMLEDLANCIPLEVQPNVFIPQVQSWKQDKIEQFKKDYLDYVSLSIFKKDVMSLPDIVHQMVKLPPSKKTLKALQFLKTTTKTKVQLLNRIAQVSDGFLYSEDYDEETDMTTVKPSYFATPKVPQLISDLRDMKEQGTHRTTIFAGYTASIDKIVETVLSCGWKVLRMDGRGYRFFNSKYDSHNNGEDYLFEFDGSMTTNRDHIAVVGHPKSIATGLELSACPVMIYYSHTNDGESEFQSVARGHSINMNMAKGLTIKHYIHCPIDQIIINKLVNKSELQSITMGELLSYI